MKILIDMNLSPEWAPVLRDAGIDSEHWSALGAADSPDQSILEFAAANDMIVLTNDLDFGAALAAANLDKPSVVQIRSGDLRPATIGKLVCRGLIQMSAELEAGALLTIDPKRVRLRLLPLRKV